MRCMEYVMPQHRHWDNSSWRKRLLYLKVRGMRQWQKMLAERAFSLERQISCVDSRNVDFEIGQFCKTER